MSTIGIYHKDGLKKEFRRLNREYNRMRKRLLKIQTELNEWDQENS